MPGVIQRLTSYLDLDLDFDLIRPLNLDLFIFIRRLNFGNFSTEAGDHFLLEICANQWIALRLLSGNPSL